MQAGQSSLSLRVKLIVLVSGTALVTMLLIGGSISYSVREIATKLAMERLTGEAQLAALKVRATYTAMKNDAFVVAQTPPVLGYLQTTLSGAADPTNGMTADAWREQLNQIFASFLQTHPHYTQIRFIGVADSGRELVRVNKQADGRIETITPASMQQKNDEPYFREAMKLPRNQIYFSDVTYNREHGRIDPALTPTIRMVFPVFRPNSDERFGLIVINANYHTLLVEALKDIEINGDVYVSDRFGNYIHRAGNGVISRLQVHENYTAPAPEFINRFSSRQQTAGEILDGGRVGFVTRLAIDPQQPGDYFGVFLLASNTELLAGVHGMLYQSLFVGLLIILTAAAAAAVSADRLMRPITQMTDAIRSYSSGNAYLLDLPVNLRGEIGEMSKAFLSLMTRLDLTTAHHTKLSTQLETFITNSTDGFVVINELGLIEQANPALLALFGYEREEIIGQNVSILMPEGLSYMHDGFIRAYRELGIKTYIGTVRNEDARHKDGTIFPITLSVSEIKLSDRRIFSAIIRDVTSAREATKLSVQLEAFIANAVDGFIVINERGFIEQVNPALLGLFGYEPGELIGQNVAVLMPDAVRDKHDDYLQSYRHTERKTYIGTIRDEQARRKDGTIFPIALSISEIRLSDRRIFSAIIRDMSVIRQAQQELRHYSTELTLSHAQSTRLSAQIEAFIASSVDGFVVVNERGVIEQANPALLELFGYERGELIGKNVSILMPDAARNTHDSYLSSYRKTGQKTYIGTLRDEQARRKDGSTFPIALSVSEVPLGDRRIFSAVIRDMSAIQEAQRRIKSYTVELERSNHELDQFAYSASHDLKAPLRVIDNASRWLEEDLDSKLSDEDRENMALLRNRVKRMERLLDDLLAYSRVGRAVDERYQETVDGGRLVEDILVMLAPPAAMQIKVSERFAAMRVTRMPLLQVLQNLIDNAIKHHDREDGTIELDAVEDGQWLRFTVSDDGPGIPAEFQDTIFKMFHTLKPRDQVEGSGMGLALAKKTVEFFGGEIAVRSDGRGSTFTFTWPGTVQPSQISNQAA